MVSAFDNRQTMVDRLWSCANKRLWLIAGTAFTIIVFIWYSSSRDLPLSGSTPFRSSSSTAFNGVWNYRRDRDNLLLNHAQCSAAFPDLFEEVDRAVTSRKEKRISLSEIDSIPAKNGYVRAMIYNQQLYVIAVQGKIYSRGQATLHAIHRALISSPTPLPNIEFAFSTDDIVFDQVALWGYARRSTDTYLWLMPDFGYWSWPETKVGSMREVQLKAVETEADEFSWGKKIPKLLWRGATMGLPLRDHLLEVTKGKIWADVVSLDWHNSDSMSKDLKSMSEHCQYRYLAQTEGNSYSGRLKYLQSCESVIISHKMDWIQHHHPLMHSSGPSQNFVELNREFEGLEETILSLESNPKEAQRIARNNVKTFRERYLTPAAEACYWRRLIQGWSEVSFEPEFYKIVDGKKVWRGLPVESFLLEGRMDWDPY